MTAPTSDTRSAGLPRLPALTGLRFVAAAAVVGYHVARYVEPLGPLRHITGLGYSGVGFFFVLSGFVLAWSARPGRPARRFYLDRFARVWPLHALTTAVAALPFLAWQDTHDGAGTLVAVLLLVQAWWPWADVQFAFNGVSWSLSCEAFFYLVFPLFAYRALRLDRDRLLRAGLLVAAVLLAGALLVMILLPPEGWNWALYVMPGYRLGEFVLGVLLACAVRGGWRAPLGLRTSLLLLLAVHAGLLVAVGVLADGRPGLLPQVVTDLVMLPVFCLVVAAAASDAVLGRPTVFARPAWVRLGEWSFALYLVHELVLRGLLRVVSDDVPAALVQTLLALALAVALSGVLHHGVERPCERRIKAWADRRVVTFAAPSPDAPGEPSGLAVLTRSPGPVDPAPSPQPARTPA